MVQTWGCLGKQLYFVGLVGFFHVSINPATRRRELNLWAFLRTPSRCLSMLLARNILRSAVILGKQTRLLDTLHLEHRSLYHYLQLKSSISIVRVPFKAPRPAVPYNSMSSRPQKPAKPLPTDLPIRAFSSVGEFEAYLEREHTTAAGIYLKFAKKASGIASISGAEAVETALCFGWIDGRANPFDDNWWLVRYTPRRAKSIWSQKNVNTIERLTEQGRMRPAGIAAVEAAKADGRWDRAYAGPATITIPDDLATALKADAAASAFLDNMTKADRYSILMRLQITSPKLREQRIQSLVEQLAADHANSVLKPNKKNGVRKAKAKPKPAARGQVLKIDAPANANNATPCQTNIPRRAGLRSRA